MSCTQEQIKEHCQSGKLRKEKVLTPEWGGDGHVFIRGLMATENDVATNLRADDDADEATKRRMGMVSWCIACACNEEGVRIFNDDSVEWLASKDSPLAPIYRCSMKAMKMNGLDEDAVGNLKPTRSGSSP